jgi:hypothetical protein
VHVGFSFGGTPQQGLQAWVDGVPAATASILVDASAVDCTLVTQVGIAGNDNALVIGASNARNSLEGDVDPSTSQYLAGELDQIHVRASWRDFSRL